MRSLKTPQRPRVASQVSAPVDEGLDWGAAGWAGLAGGAAFLVILTLGLISAGGGGLTGAVRLLASVARGASALLAHLAFGIVVAAVYKRLTAGRRLLY